ncbi:MAG: cysteine--tRNA ligase [Candidatus Peribacteraceae bacterium]|nr:cysteine--tRNA ligase [Candidatus Peribacteraceae bacterium]
MLIRFTNSLGRKKEVFEPLEKGRVKIYSCGPTVYASPHIGNFRAFIFADLLSRSFEFWGYEVENVMNVTDVGHLTSDSDSGEDKLEKSAAKEKVSPLEIARKYEKEFLVDLDKLNIKKPKYLPRASEHITEQVELIKKLAEQGFTYETSDGIYFDTGKFKNYGELSGQKAEEKEAGARVAVKSEKNNPADFALWKFCVGENANHILRWDIATGKDLSDQQPATSNQQLAGFPGWHLECSAMSLKYLAPEILQTTNYKLPAAIDIHTGGVDHIPVHHENEIAQSEAATGKKFVNFWLHNEFLTVDGGKMSKSLGNLFTLADLERKRIEPLAFRYFCLNSNYRGKLNFTFEALENAQSSLKKLRNEFQKAGPKGKVDQKAVDQFSEALADDLNSPRALAAAWEYARSPKANQATFNKFDEVLGLDLAHQENNEVKITPELQKLLDERAAARAAKDFKKSDELRDQIFKLGFDIEDTADGNQLLKNRA